MKIFLTGEKNIDKNPVISLTVRLLSENTGDFHSDSCDLIIMDDEYFSEKDSPGFRSRVFGLLETRNNVLGILPDEIPQLSSGISEMKDVLLIRVTEDNLHLLPEILAGCILHQRNLAAIIMASGHSKRFGSNKLLTGFRGKPLIENLMEKIPSALFSEVCVVSIYDEILDLCEKYRIKPVRNTDITDDISVTIRTGLENIDRNVKGCMFIVGDQPLLKSETIMKLASRFYNNPDRICLLNSDGRRGNPVVFPNSLFHELMSLQNHQSGRSVIANHPDEITECSISDSRELLDADFPADLRKLMC